MPTVNIWEVDQCAANKEKQIPFATMREELQVAVAGQTLFTLQDISYTPGASNLAVFLNGVRQSLEAGDFVETSRVAVKFTAALTEGETVLFVVNDYTTSVPDLSRTLLESKGSTTSAGQAFDQLSVHSLDELRGYDGVSGFSKAIVWGTEELGDGPVAFYYYVANSQALESEPAVIKPTAVDIGRWILVSSTTVVVQQPPELFCPGYTPVFVSATQFSFTGLDLTALFSAGRRVKVDGSKDGTITDSTFAAGDTTVTVTMDGTDTITADIASVCLTNSNTSWVPVAGLPVNQASIREFASGSIDGTNILIAVCNEGQILRSTDGGVSFTAIASGTTQDLLSVAFNETDESFWAVGVATTVLKSVDGGLTWAAPAALPSTVDAGKECDKVVYALVDGATPGIAIAVRSAAGATSFDLRYTVDGGATWAGSLSAGSYGKMSYSSGLFMIARNNNTILYTTDSLAAVSLGSKTLGVGSLWPAGAIQAFNRELSLVGGINGLIRKSINLDLSAWTAVADSSFGSTTIQSIAIVDNGDLLDPMIVAVGSAGKIAYSVDDGDTWTQVPNGFAVSDSILCVYYDKHEKVFLAGSLDGIICRSTNGIQ